MTPAASKVTFDVIFGFMHPWKVDCTPKCSIY